MSGGRAARDLTEGPVLGHLLRFVVPMSIGLVATMTNGLVDAFWLGHLGATELAAVSFAFPVTFAVFAVAIGMSSGAVAAVSRAVGAGDRGRVRRLTTDAMLLGLVISAVVTALGLASITPLFTALGAKEELLGHIDAYMSVWFYGFLFIAAPVIGNAILRALGDAIFPSALMALAAIVNIILDPLLIFGVGPFPRMEVAGAALATVLANVAMFVVVGVLFTVRERLIAFEPVALKTVLRHWRDVAHVGLPAMVSTGINPIALIAVVAATARFGEAAVAGYGVAARIEALAFIPLFALSAAMAPIAGQNGGAGHLGRVRECFRDSFKIAFIWSTATAVLLIVGGGWIAGFFVDPNDPAAEEVRRTARSYLMIVPLTSWGYGVAMAASAGFNGLSRPLIGLSITVGRSMLLMAPAAWLGASVFDAPAGVWAGIAAANIIAGLAIAIWVLTRAYPPSIATPQAAE